MKIVHVVPVTPPIKGGMGAVAFEYARAEREAGHDVEIVDKTSKWAWFKMGHAAVIPSLMRRVKQYDLVHLHYPFYGAALFTAIGCKLTRTPYVATFHMQATGKGLYGLVFKVHRALFRSFILSGAKVVLCSTLDYAKEAGVKHSNLVEQPFWADVPKTLPKCKVQPKAKDNALRLVFIGGMDRPHYFKGVPVLLNALAILASRGEANCELTLIGGGELLAEYKALAKQLKVDHLCTFLGRVSDEEKWKTLVSSDVHILPSTTKAEAFGIVTVEAKVAGIPSIVSDLPGVRSLVRDGVSGFVVLVGDSKTMADRIETLMHAPELLETMKNSSKESSTNFEKSILLKHLLAVYEGVTVNIL